MKAIVHRRYGPPGALAFSDVAIPDLADDHVLVRVIAAAVHPGDLLLMAGRPILMRPVFGLSHPKKATPGYDLAGVVDAVGPAVDGIGVGDEVFGQSAEGSCAEYATVSNDAVAPKPAGLTFQQAAAVPMSGLTALHALRDVASVHDAQRVLINGASGGIGTFAVQIGKAFGAHVTGVCSTRNVDLVRELGADVVVDYTRTDFVAGGERYDVILDNVSNRALSQLRRALTPTGILIPNNGTSGDRWLGPLPRMLHALVLSPFVSQRLKLFVSQPTRADLMTLCGMIDDGAVIPVVDRTYPLAETAQAMTYLAQGHARGKVVIAI